VLTELMDRVRHRREDVPEWSIQRTCRVACRLMETPTFGLWEGVSVFCVAFLLAPTRRWVVLFIVGLLVYELVLYGTGRVGYGSTHTWSAWTRLRVVLFSIAGYVVGKWWWMRFHRAT
jgi:hypothetical protein